MWRLVCLSLALVVSVQAESWMDSKMVWFDQQTILGDAYLRDMENQGTTHVSNEPSTISFDLVGQRLLYTQERRLYALNRFHESSPILVSPGVEVKEYALSASTGTILLLTTKGETLSLPLTGSEESTNLKLDEYAIEQMTVDPVEGKLYFTTSHLSVYSAQPDGTSPQLLAQLQPTCTITKYISAYNDTVYIPVLCSKEARLLVCEPSGTVSNMLIRELREQENTFVMSSIFPDAQYLVWSSSGSLDQGTWATSWGGEGETLRLKETTLLNPRPTGFLLLGGSPKDREEAAALKFCHLGGYLNGSRCECDSIHYGETCSVVCDPHFNCLEGQCEEDGQCVCPVGYSRVRGNGYRCEMVTASIPTVSSSPTPLSTPLYTQTTENYVSSGDGYSHLLGPLLLTFLVEVLVIAVVMYVPLLACTLCVVLYCYAKRRFVAYSLAGAHLQEADQCEQPGECI